MSILKLSNIDYYYTDGDTKRYILKDINLEFEKGKFYSVVGRSGSGKTTLLSLLAALDKPKAGTITFDDKLIEEIGFEKYRRNNIGIIFQAYNLIDYLTAAENVLVAISETDNEVPSNKSEVATNLLDYIGIDKNRSNRLPSKLSGGEMQRVAIARALSTNVDVILADEPTGNLDAETEKDIVNIFKKLAHEHNKCIVMVTHSKEVASEADVTYTISNGEIKISENEK